jgi:PAS domain S-box-containing protein
LTQILDGAMASIVDVMGIEVIRVYILDEESGQLNLAAHRGISDDFIKGVKGIRLGEGFNGMVAQTGEPLFVEDASLDDRPTRAVVRQENIRSQFIVPLRSKGKVAGTLCVSMHSHRSFTLEEMDLLNAIGNQIGVAVENAHLYQQERKIGEQLRASEQRYRGLFENAHDAICLQDLEGHIVAANRSCIRLTGYSLEDLHNLKLVELISKDSLDTVASAQKHLLTGAVSGYRNEIRINKADGSEAVVQLASNLINNNDRPEAIQYIARDVTQQKQLQENLRFFLQQINRTQEEERKRVASELHDDTIQALIAHCQNIDMFSRTKGLNRQASLRLDKLHQQANEIMQGVRRLVQNLRPAILDNLGLVPALEWLVADSTGYSSIVTKLEVIGNEQGLPAEIELVLFHISQEALRNVWKHSQANSVNITLEYTDRKIRLTISDNGKGFDPPHIVSDLSRRGKVGLARMQEQVLLLGGTLEIRSEPDKGTTVTTELPV